MTMHKNPTPAQVRTLKYISDGLWYTPSNESRYALYCRLWDADLVTQRGAVDRWGEPTDQFRITPEGLASIGGVPEDPDADQ